MKNFVQKGATIDLVAPAAVASGAGALVGAVFGVAVYDIASGATGSFRIAGVLDLAKAAGAVTQGALMYWDNTAKNVTTTSSANTKIGVATQAQASGDATCRVRLNASF
jgi:predicted RecA/RadA family phage recombinase